MFSVRVVCFRNELQRVVVSSYFVLQIIILWQIVTQLSQRQLTVGLLRGIELRGDALRGIALRINAAHGNELRRNRACPRQPRHSECRPV